MSDDPSGHRWLRHLGRLTDLLVDNPTGESRDDNCEFGWILRISRRQARVLASAEFENFPALPAPLTPQEWATDTDCVGWDVRTMVLPVLGSADAQVSPLSPLG